MVDISSSSPASHGLGIRAFFASLFSRRGAADPLGIFAGFTAYRIYNALAEKSDAELAGMGLARADIAQVAFRRAYGS